MNIIKTYGSIKGGVFLIAGLALINIATGVDYLGTGEFQLPWGHINIKLGSSNLELILKVILTLSGVGLMAVPAIMAIRKQTHDEALLNKKKVFAIQLSGLNDVPITPIADAIPKNFDGHRTTKDIDVRAQLQGGHRIEAAINQIDQTGTSLRVDVGQMNSSDYELFTGGLAPVPLLFQLGNILEDESRVHWMDWQRDQKQWIDTKNCRTISIWEEIDTTNVVSKEIVLVIDVSYHVNESSVLKAFPGIPVIKWGPKEKLLGVIFSKESADLFCDHFRKLLLSLAEKNVEKIHLVIAASSSLAMRLGSCYDPRNMLPVTVYQYEQADSNPYPWGVSIKVHHGEKKTMLIKNQFNATVSFPETRTT
jgi:hypothetical protein